MGYGRLIPLDVLALHLDSFGRSAGTEDAERFALALGYVPLVVGHVKEHESSASRSVSAELLCETRAFVRSERHADN